MKFLSDLFQSKDDGNQRLVKAMNDLALNKTPPNRERVYRALLQSILLVPVPEIPAGLQPGAQKVMTPVQLQLTVMLDRNQHRVTSVFTDIEALRNWDPNTPYLGINAQELFRFVLGMDLDEIVINPFDPIRRMIRPGGTITRWEMESLANGYPPKGGKSKIAEVKIGDAEHAMIGAPAESLRTEVEQELKMMADSMTNIDELYLFQMATRDGKDWISHKVIGIVTQKSVSVAAANSIAKQFGENIQPRLANGESLDFMALGGNFETQIRKNGILLFKRQS